MAAVLIWCPNTGEPVKAGIGADPQSWAEMELAVNRLTSCSGCGGTHTWSKKHAWLEGQPPSIFRNPGMRL